MLHDGHVLLALALAGFVVATKGIGWQLSPPDPRKQQRNRRIAYVIVGAWFLCPWLEELLQLYGSESIDEVLVGNIDRKKRLNRLVELKSKGMLSIKEHHEIEHVERVLQRCVESLVKQKAQSRGTIGKNGAQGHATDSKHGIANGVPLG